MMRFMKMKTNNIIQSDSNLLTNMNGNTNQTETDGVGARVASASISLLTGSGVSTSNTVGTGVRDHVP